jgi:membrane protease YdiL (CAAX protease family)
VRIQDEVISMNEAGFAPQPVWQRLLQHPLTRLIVLGAVMLYFMGWAQARLEDFHDRPLLNAAVQIGLGLAAIALYISYGKLIERRDVTELSTPGLAREWAIGALIGAGLYTACAVILMLLGIYRVEGFNSWTFLLPNLALAIKSGVFEELLFRGILFRSVEAIFGSWAGIVVSSLAFGLLHLLNPDATLGGAIYICIEAGLLLSAAYLVTRRLWIGIGIHMAWNYFQSAVFSGVVSGAVSDPGLLKATIEGPEFLTGGSFGMEHSLVALVLCTSAGVILLMIAIRRGHIMPPFWKR